MQIKSDELTQMILDAYEKGRARGREEALATVPLSPFPLPSEPIMAPFRVTCDAPGTIPHKGPYTNPCPGGGAPHFAGVIYCLSCQP
jgi:hypothetical protein